MHISDWMSDVCSSDLRPEEADRDDREEQPPNMHRRTDDLPRGAEDIMVDDQVPRLCFGRSGWDVVGGQAADDGDRYDADDRMIGCDQPAGDGAAEDRDIGRSEEHTSELQSLMRISY